MPADCWRMPTPGGGGLPSGIGRYLNYEVYGYAKQHYYETYESGNLIQQDYIYPASGSTLPKTIVTPSNTATANIPAVTSLPYTAGTHVLAKTSSTTYTISDTKTGTQLYSANSANLQIVPLPITDPKAFQMNCSQAQYLGMLAEIAFSVELEAAVEAACGGSAACQFLVAPLVNALEEQYDSNVQQWINEYCWAD